MKKTKDQVTTENRRALPKFLGILLLSGLVGAGSRPSGGDRRDFRPGGVLSRRGLGSDLDRAGSLGYPVTSLLFLGLEWGCYKSAHTLFLSWDGENEAISGAVDRRLNWVLLFTFLVNVLDFFFLAVGLFYNGGLLVVAEMLVSLVLLLLLQQRVVDLVRRMNPEKRGQCL